MNVLASSSSIINTNCLLKPSLLCFLQHHSYFHQTTLLGRQVCTFSDNYTISISASHTFTTNNIDGFNNTSTLCITPEMPSYFIHSSHQNQHSIIILVYQTQHQINHHQNRNRLILHKFSSPQKQIIQSEKKVQKSVQPLDVQG